MPAKTLYARQTILLGRGEFQPGDELPEAEIVRSDIGFDRDARGKFFITDRQGRHWRITNSGTSGHATAELVHGYDPEASFPPDLVERGLATTDADEAAALRKIVELERERNPETSDTVDAQIAKLQAQLP